MSKRIIGTTNVNGVDVDIYTEDSNYFVKYNDKVKNINVNTYYMLDVFRDLDPMFSYLEDKDLHGEEFSNKEKDLYNNYINEAKRLRYLK